MNLISPNGNTHEIGSIREFIRNHPESFSPDDTLIRHKPSGGEYTRAEAGLYLLVKGKTGSWKGWTRQQDNRHGIKKIYHNGSTDCAHCGKHFEKPTANSAYCSSACRTDYYAINVVGRKSLRHYTCQQCGLPASSIHDHARFCDKKCADLWHYNNTRVRPALRPSHCAHCGSVFGAGSAALGGRLHYCSDACKDSAKAATRKARKAAARIIGDCRTCGAHLTHHLQQYCPACYRKRHNTMIRRIRAQDQKRRVAKIIKKITNQ